jgi:thymidine kinase
MVLSPKLVVNAGGMFASKSTALIAQGKRHLLAGHKVLFVKPDMDNRYAEEEIVTHDGQKVDAIKVGTYQTLFAFIPTAEADVILIDEVQFFDWNMVQDIEALLKRGKVIYVSGLDMDYTGTPFHITAHLMAIADEVNKYKAVCSICGEDSYVTAKTSGSNDRVELGSQDKYKPVCRPCFNKLEEAK